MMKNLLNIVEYNGKWHKLSEDAECEKFTMKDLKELLIKERKESIEYEREKIHKILVEDLLILCECENGECNCCDRLLNILDKLKQ